MNLARLFARTAGVMGRQPAVALGGEVLLTYEALCRRAATIAGALRTSLGAGERVALVMRNHPAYVELLLACWHAGLTAVPVNAKLHPREIAYILEHSGARLAFATADLAEAVAPLARTIVADSAEHERLAAGAPMAIAETAPDDVAWLFYTSGTTGRPKGAMLTHRNLLAMTLAYYASVDDVAPGDALLHAAPMSHGSGLYILPFAARGAVQVIAPSGGFEPGEVLEMIRAHPGACLFAAPTMVKRLAEHPRAASADSSGLKAIVYGGGPMYRADLARAEAVFGHRLAQIYGQGESPMTITALDNRAHADTDHPRYEPRIASVGIAQMGIELSVAGADDRPLPAGEVGEVLVRGASVMKGYWRDPEASTATLRGGWLRTGDLGSLDADGFLTLRDRSKDLIISGGANVYPREVEEVLLRHEAVAEAAVVGAPHAEWGEEVVAFVVASRPVSAPELDTLCLAAIARYKRPRHYRFVDALPKNNYGKVLKTELRARLEEEG